MSEDRELLDELRSLLSRVDPVPDAVYANAEAACTLAWLEDGWERLAPVAGAALLRSDARTFRFAGKGICVEVRLCRLPWGVRLDGLAAPASAIEVRWPTGSVGCRPDAAGLFRLDDLPLGPLRIELGSLATPWFWP